MSNSTTALKKILALKTVGNILKYLLKLFADHHFNYYYFLIVGFITGCCFSKVQKLSLILLFLLKLQPIVYRL